MNDVEMFRETVQAAITTATTGGIEPSQLNRLLLGFTGLSLDFCGEAAENLDALIER